MSHVLEALGAGPDATHHCGPVVCGSEQGFHHYSQFLGASVCPSLDCLWARETPGRADGPRPLSPLFGVEHQCGKTRRQDLSDLLEPPPAGMRGCTHTGLLLSCKRKVVAEVSPLFIKEPKCPTWCTVLVSFLAQLHLPAVL